MQLMSSLANRHRAVVSLTTVAALRMAVGAVMLAFAKPVLGLQTGGKPSGQSVLLMRIIGVRDLLIGLGTLTAGRSDTSQLVRWSAVGLANDVADAVIAGSSADLIGVPSAALTASGSIPFAAAEIWALKQLRRRHH